MPKPKRKPLPLLLSPFLGAIVSWIPPVWWAPGSESRSRHFVYNWTLLFGQKRGTSKRPRCWSKIPCYLRGYWMPDTGLTRCSVDLFFTARCMLLMTGRKNGKLSVEQTFFEIVGFYVLRNQILLELAAELKKAKYAGLPVLNGPTSDEFAFRSLCQPNHPLKEIGNGKGGK